MLAISIFVKRFPAFFLNARCKPRPFPANPSTIVTAYTLVITSLLVLLKISVELLPNEKKKKKKGIAKIQRYNFPLSKKEEASVSTNRIR